MNKKKVFLTVLIIISFAGLVLAGEKENKGQTKKVLKTITGEVGGIGPNFIAIVYQKDEEKGVEYEIALPLKENVKFQFVKSLKDLKVGDKVTVQYEEETTTYTEKVKDEKGKEKEEIKEESKRQATIIKFESRPQPQSVYLGEQTQQTEGENE